MEFDSEQGSTTCAAIVKVILSDPALLLSVPENLGINFVTLLEFGNNNCTELWFLLTTVIE